MTKVYCKKYKEELPALDRPPYPGPRGEEIFNSVSKKAWMEWLQLQTMLINEKQLNLAEKETRDYLNDQLDKFLNNGDVDKPVGFKPVE
jgi:Fe-S cluster biosynthesis and repair protein YggX|tara:strand:+ start:594 stop:860 length:267 start_codon:yes stop_codon:yes gene_type:complete